MQVFVGGIPRVRRLLHLRVATLALEPQPLTTWCLWLKWDRLVRSAAPCFVTHGDRCNWSRATPSAMTISPVNTRLIRASAFELRSKTCAMSAFLFPLPYLTCGRMGFKGS